VIFWSFLFNSPAVHCQEKRCRTGISDLWLSCWRTVCYLLLLYILTQLDYWCLCYITTLFPFRSTCCFGWGHRMVVRGQLVQLKGEQDIWHVSNIYSNWLNGKRITSTDRPAYYDYDYYYYYYYYYYFTIYMSPVTGLFFLVLPLKQRWSPPLTLQSSHCINFCNMCDLPSTADFCMLSSECFATRASKFSLSFSLLFQWYKIYFKIHYYYYYFMSC